MKKRLLCFITLLTVTISAVTLTNNVKAATKWNTSKSVTKEENGIKYSAYLTEDGKESWIYRIKLSRMLTKLKLPEEINQAKLTRVGYGGETNELIPSVVFFKHIKRHLEHNRHIFFWCMNGMHFVGIDNNKISTFQ